MVDLERARSSMASEVSAPVLRRPNTKDLIQQAILQPESMPPNGRDRLAQWAVERYGPSARHIIPYLGVEEPQ